jgi:predicted transcriptional regulator of viral defense system
MKRGAMVTIQNGVRLWPREIAMFNALVARIEGAFNQMTLVGEFDIQPNDANNVLSRLHRAGLLKRVAIGTYDIREAA